jgi:Bacterial Ig domain
MKCTLLFVCAQLMLVNFSNAQINITASGFASENFNSMNTGTTVPSGWKMSASGTTADWLTGTNSTSVTQVANSGTPGSSGRYNWATTAATDRAIGFMTDGSYASPNTILAQIHNNTNATITSITITFQIERYRINTSTFYLQFYSSSTGSSWTSQSAGDISAAVFTPGASSYTFSTPQTVYKTVTISALNIANNSDYYFRWVFGSGGTNGQGAGLDNVTVNVNTANPIVTASLADGVTEPAKQGDPLTYTAIINNKGKDATAVQYNASLDANTTLNGSVKSSALANDDIYSTALNTQLIGQNVLTNDFGLPSLSVLFFGSTETPASSNAGNSGFSDNGGIVVVNANGTFTYTPPTGFVGYDRFAYTAHAGVSPDDVGIVTIAVGSQTSGANETISSIIGNVAYSQIASPSTGLLFNDGGDGKRIGSVNGDPANVGNSFITANGSNVMINSDGSFDYNPGPGFEGVETIHYTIDNGLSNPATADVDITVSGMIWFINSAAASNGDGRISSPFNSLANFQAINNGTGNNPAANDNIFLYESGTDYTGPITLLNGQKLIGQDATASLETITGYSTQLNKSS